MPRDIPAGNGSLLVNFDQAYQLRDLYWPHVGQENHTAGHPFRFGVWVDGQLRWLDDAGWQRTLEYVPQTLITQDMLNWAVAHALPSGVMAEQVHPYTNAPLSVSPLTWSHATLVMSVCEYAARRQAIGG